MGDAKALARHAVEEIAFDGVVGRKGNRMHQAVEAVPALCQLREYRLDLGILGNVTGVDGGRPELVGVLRHALLEAFVLVGEGEFGAFAVAGLGNAVGDRPVGDQAGDQDAFASEKSHRVFLG